MSSLGGPTFKKKLIRGEICGANFIIHCEWCNFGKVSEGKFGHFNSHSQMAQKADAEIFWSSTI